MAPERTCVLAPSFVNDPANPESEITPEKVVVPAPVPIVKVCALRSTTEVVAPVRDAISWFAPNTN